MGTLRFFEEVVSFKIRRTFGFADYKSAAFAEAADFLSFCRSYFHTADCRRKSDPPVSFGPPDLESGIPDADLRVKSTKGCRQQPAEEQRASRNDCERGRFSSSTPQR